MPQAAKPAPSNRRHSPGVATRHPQYDKYAKKWKRARDVTNGQDAIYEGNEKYLPKLVDETALEYHARQNRTPFFNASWRTVAGFVGMIFRKPPTKNIPKALEAYLADVTMTGISFDTLAKDVVYEDLIVSFVGLHVDHPPLVVMASGRAPTKAEAEKAGLRPSMRRYEAEHIRNFAYRFFPERNRTVLGEVRLDEVRIEKKSEFESEEIEIIRMLELDEDGFYRVRIFLTDTEEELIDELVYPLMNGQKMTEIPFEFIGPDGTFGKYEEPVMIDLFDLNIKHFQVSADYEHGCHFTALPTPYVTGYKQQVGPDGKEIKETFRVGSTNMLVFPNAETKVGYAEFTGTGLTTLENNLDRKEAQMAAIGARMLAPDKSGVEAAETLAMRHSGENSILSAVAVSCSDGLTKSLKVFAAWLNIAGEIEYKLNRDFVPMVIDPARMTSLLAAVQAGRLSGESFFDLMQRGDIIPAETTYEEEQARIDATEIPPPVGAEPTDDDPSKKKKEEKKTGDDE